MLLSKTEQCEKIARVAHQIFLNFFTKKPNDSLRKPMSEFPALEKGEIMKVKQYTVCMYVKNQSWQCSHISYVQYSEYSISINDCHWLQHLWFEGIP